MGQYGMTARAAARLEDGGVRKEFVELDGGPRFNDAGMLLGCELSDLTGEDFSFEAILSRESTSQKAWMTLSTYSREGTFDGQVLSTTAEANRVFAACAKCSTRMVETISVAVLSRSQSLAAGGQCPEHPLDGGVMLDPDAGIVAPADSPLGFDGVLLCGEITNRVVAEVDEEDCPAQCDGCTVRYLLRGDRR